MCFQRERGRGRGNCQGNVSRSDNTWLGFWRMNRILIDEQERGRSRKGEGAHTNTPLSILCFSAGCTLDLWDPEWFREWSLKPSGAFCIWFVDLGESEDSGAEVGSKSSRKLWGNQVWKAFARLLSYSERFAFGVQSPCSLNSIAAEHCCSFLRDAKLGGPWADVLWSGLDQTYDVRGTNQHSCGVLEESMLLERLEREWGSITLSHLALWNAPGPFGKSIQGLPKAFSGAQGTQSSGWAN